MVNLNSLHRGRAKEIYFQINCFFKVTNQVVSEYLEKSLSFYQQGEDGRWWQYFKNYRKY